MADPDVPRTDGGAPESSWWRPWMGVAALALALGAVFVLVATSQAGRDDGDLATRQAEVARRAATVMPFAQDATMHRFEKTDRGGVQDVTVNDPSDADQIELIREHLRGERDRFVRGDFADPASIHGAEMPGLDALADAARTGVLTVGYEALPAGGRLTYDTSDGRIAEAVHRWFDAQLRDHGSHATT